MGSGSPPAPADQRCWYGRRDDLLPKGLRRRRHRERPVIHLHVHPNRRHGIEPTTAIDQAPFAILLNYDGRSLESVPLDVLAECEQFLRIERGKQIGMSLARAVGAECSIPPAPTRTLAEHVMEQWQLKGVNARPRRKLLD
jgi:hypothetical protein